VGWLSWCFDLVAESTFAARGFGSDLALELVEEIRLVVLVDHRFEVNNGLRGVETLRAALGAVHDAMAAVKLHGVVQPGKTFVGHVIAGIDDPTISLLQDSRSEVVLRVPPIRWARGRATSAEDALV